MLALDLGVRWPLGLRAPHEAREWIVRDNVDPRFLQLDLVHMLA